MRKSTASLAELEAVARELKGIHDQELVVLNELGPRMQQYGLGEVIQPLQADSETVHTDASSKIRDATKRWGVVRQQSQPRRVVEYQEEIVPNVSWPFPRCVMWCVMSCLVMSHYNVDRASFKYTHTRTRVSVHNSTPSPQLLRRSSSSSSSVVVVFLAFPVSLSTGPRARPHTTRGHCARGRAQHAAARPHDHQR